MQTLGFSYDWHREHIQRTGCDSCDRLAEAWAKMRETLTHAASTLADMTTEDYAMGGDRQLRMAVNDALRLADEVMRRKGTE